MRKNAVIVVIAVSIFALPQIAPVCATSSFPSSAQSADLRRPFALALPDLGEMVITEPEARIPTSNLRTIQLKILNPFADSIPYGKIYTKINGESSGTIQGVKSGRDGKVITLDLDMKPRFRLHPGKNVVEVNAVGQDKNNYYASFVLMAGGQAVTDQSRMKDVIAESHAVTTGEDRKPPSIFLAEPKGAIRAAGDSTSLKVHGVVIDDSGAIASVTVNGQPAALSASAGARALAVRPDAASGATGLSGIAFDRTTIIASSASSVVVEAKDRAGNITRLLIPVLRREAAVSSQFKGRKFALVVGVSRYKYHEGGLSDLGYADSDARSIRDFLKLREGGNFSPSDIFYLENEQATIDELRAALTSFLPKAAPNDLVFIFIAGHGAPDPYDPQNLYFLMHDTRVADMPNTALPMSELHRMLDHNVRAERVVALVDTCHSAGLSGERLVTARGLENNLVNLYAAKLYKEAGRAVLTSSDINEVSQESPQWGGGHGIFTLALLEGFRGEADTNSDRLITAGELFAYVRNRVRTATGFLQNPRALPGLSADLTLTFVPPEKSR